MSALPEPLTGLLGPEGIPSQNDGSAEGNVYVDRRSRNCEDTAINFISGHPPALEVSLPSSQSKGDKWKLLGFYLRFLFSFITGPSFAGPTRVGGTIL